MRAKVWDKLNGSEETALELDYVEHPEGYALSTEDDEVLELAERFAKQDTDGHTDGLYENAQPIVVLLENGARYVVDVRAQYEPRFYGHVKERP